MRKIRLELDTLQIDSFSTGREGATEKGTVQARESGSDYSYFTGCPSMSWSGANVCFCCMQPE
jgi:hypothetical protein